MFDNYFHKHGEFRPSIQEKPNQKLGIIVVIPCYNELELNKSLLSLIQCIQPSCAVEIITVINYPEGSGNEVIAISKQSMDIINKLDSEMNNPFFRFHYIYAANLPKKHAGVGLARKIGMDEAAWRFNLIKNHQGIIACFDADSQCELNYLVELEKLWREHPKTSACSIRFQHPLEGLEFDEKIYTGIAQYELHLRYYYQAGRLIGFPFAYHTIGSSMACSASTYVKYGGMNRNQAGEDFYFLQKIIPHGNFKELNSTCIFPSPRPSFRVPFGTGRAMMKYLEGNSEPITTYNLDSFLALIPLFSSIDKLYNSDKEVIKNQLKLLPGFLSEYLSAINADEKIDEVKQNTTTRESFRKRFFLWFDAFQLLKYLNYINETHFNRMPVASEAKRILKLKKTDNLSDDPIQLLKIFRDLELV